MVNNPHAFTPKEDGSESEKDQMTRKKISKKILAFAFARCEWALMGEQTVSWNCDGRRNLNLCNILIRPYFPVHIRCVHKHNTHLCKPSWLRSRSFGKSCTTWGCTWMGQVFTFARGEVLEYCASQNATPITEAFSSVQVILEKTGTHFWLQIKIGMLHQFW